MIACTFSLSCFSLPLFSFSPSPLLFFPFLSFSISARKSLTHRHVQAVHEDKHAVKTQLISFKRQSGRGKLGGFYVSPIQQVNTAFFPHSAWNTMHNILFFFFLSVFFFFFTSSAKKTLSRWGQLEGVVIYGSRREGPLSFGVGRHPVSAKTCHRPGGNLLRRWTEKSAEG